MKKENENLFNTPSFVLRTTSAKRKYCFTTPLPACGVLPPQGGQWKRHGALNTSRDEGTLSVRQFSTTQGFTLIELLVVVLIIGILAAVAVPQYKVAVAKSRIAAILPIIETIRKTEAAYYLANGKHTGVIQELDIDIPCTETVREEDSIALWACGRDFLVQASESNAVYASYCPNHNSSYETCAATRDIQIAYNYWNGASKGTRTCIVMNNSKLGEKVCKTLGEHAGSIYYRMN